MYKVHNDSINMLNNGNIGKHGGGHLFSQQLGGINK